MSYREPITNDVKRCLGAERRTSARHVARDTGIDRKVLSTSCRRERVVRGWSTSAAAAAHAARARASSCAFAWSRMSRNVRSSFHFTTGVSSRDTSGTAAS